MTWRIFRTTVYFCVLAVSIFSSSLVLYGAIVICMLTLFSIEWMNDIAIFCLKTPSFFLLLTQTWQRKYIELFAQNTAKQLWNVPRSRWAYHIRVVNAFVVILDQTISYIFSNFQDIISWTWTGSTSLTTTPLEQSTYHSGNQPETKWPQGTRDFKIGLEVLGT